MLLALVLACQKGPPDPDCASRSPDDVAAISDDAWRGCDTDRWIDGAAIGDVTGDGLDDVVVSATDPEGIPDVDTADGQWDTAALTEGALPTRVAMCQGPVATAEPTAGVVASNGGYFGLVVGDFDGVAPADVLVVSEHSLKVIPGPFTDGLLADRPAIATPPLELEVPGDFDGDGTGDLFVAEYGWEAPGQAWILPGPLTGATLDEAGWSLPGDDDLSWSPVGDVDGDGADDLGLGTTRDGIAIARVFTSVDSAVDAEEGDVTIQLDGTDVNVAAAVGDVDGDGLADMYVAEHVYSGADLVGEIDEGDAVAMLVTEDGCWGPDPVERLGDVDGDGFDDVLVGQVVAWGPLAGTIDDLATTRVGYWQVRGLGDVDGDGRSDLYIQDYSATPAGGLLPAAAWVDR